MPPAASASGWKIGKPDAVFETPRSFKVPATGAMDYQRVALQTNLPEDKWVTAIELKPTARAVVHHVLFASDRTGAAATEARATNDGQPGFPGLGSLFTIQAASDPPRA